MLQPNEIPVFGTRVEGCPYVVRPSAYALVRRDSGSLAAVQTILGRFLPGGGMQPGESPEMTVEREAREECGLILDARSILGHAVDIVYSALENACFEKRSTFLAADLVALVAPEEHDHELIWLDWREAAATLTHEGHRWAVRTLII